MKRKAHLPDKVYGFGGRQLAVVEEETTQVYPLNKFHGDELDPVGFGEVVNANYILVGYLVRQEKFLFEARQDGGTCGQFWANQFESYEAVQFSISGFVHRAHAAFAEQLQNFVTSSEDIAGLQHSRADKETRGL